MRDDTKLAEIRLAMESNDWETAIKIAASFVRLGKHKVAIARAAEVINRPEIYIQMGYDVDAVIDKGIIALKQRFDKSWSEVENNSSSNEKN